MDTLPHTHKEPAELMECSRHLPLDALDPLDLLRQGAAAETFSDDSIAGFTPPSIEKMAALFPQFELHELIGRGGMGAVYKVRQKELDRLVALKILPSTVGQRADFSHRFAREAKALAKLNHPGIVTIHDFGQAGELYYILMEFVDGVNLRQLMSTGRISPREALAIVPQICDALQFAHDRGIVHRDIKPENILMDRLGRVKVADFGLVKLIGTEDGGTPDGSGSATMHTEAGNVMGTPQYMAPEQLAHPLEVDHRADIYALGVVFYQMLTGELPGIELQAPSRKVQIDVRLDEIVLQALEKDPKLRFQQVSEFKTCVENTQAESPAASAYAEGERWRSRCYRSKATCFGLPWLDVACGVDPATNKASVAKGVIAIGGVAKGVVAVGGRAYGVFAFGGLAAGVFACGGLAIGAFAVGGMALALLLAFGAFAAGWSAIGGLAAGQYSFGSTPLGAHRLGGGATDQAATDFFLPWAQHFLNGFGVFAALLMGFVLLMAYGVPTVLEKRRSQSTRRVSPGALQTNWLLLLLGLFAGLFILTAAAIVFYWRGNLSTPKETKLKIGESKSSPQAPSAATKKAATDAAESWLSGIDSENYAQSWKDASTYFRSKVTEPLWGSMLIGFRKPAGKFISRKLKEVHQIAAPLGAPSTEYFVITYDSTFTESKITVETVTVLNEVGTWRVVGYFIK